MKQYNRFLILFFAGALCLGSCKKDYLEEDLLSTYSPQTTLRDSLGFEAAIAGLQAIVRNQYTVGEPQGMLSTMFLGTDVAFPGQVQGVEAPYFNYSLMNAQDDAARRYWEWAYQTINSANFIIANIKDPATKMSEGNGKSVEGEARFFRAYAYNFLATLYGGVPLIQEPLNAAKTDFTRAPLAEVNAFIVNDLNFASTNLPDVTKVKKPGRINKAAAQQLLAEVYLRTSKPDLAEAECMKIINSGLFSLVRNRYGVRKDQPGDPFNDMFIYGNQRRYQGNTEAIWVNEQEFNIPGGSSPANNDQHRRVWVPFYAGVSGMKIADSLGGRGVGRIRLSNWVIYNLYQTNDMRNSKYNMKREFWYNDPNSAKFGQKVTGLTGTDTVFRIVPYTTKWNHFIATDEFGYGSFKDHIMMRLGETYLLLAEAQFRQGKLTEAAQSINVLRNRAQADLVQASDITLDFILDERVRELIGEENRRMTLVRTGALVDRVKKYNPVSATTIQNTHMLLPIPQQEIDLNKKAKLDQNPGY